MHNYSSTTQRKDGWHWNNFIFEKSNLNGLSQKKTSSICHLRDTIAIDS